VSKRDSAVASLCTPLLGDLQRAISSLADLSDALSDQGESPVDDVRPRAIATIQAVSALLSLDSLLLRLKFWEAAAGEVAPSVKTAEITPIMAEFWNSNNFHGFIRRMQAAEEAAKSIAALTRNASATETMAKAVKDFREVSARLAASSSAPRSGGPADRAPDARRPGPNQNQQRTQSQQVRQEAAGDRSRTPAASGN
jgi:hypothetical protein